MTPADNVSIGGQSLARGDRRQLERPVTRLVTGSWLNLPVVVLRGVETGPTIWLSGALHGDEVDGTEIIRRILERLKPDNLAGTVIAAPIVNVFGFVAESRYLPDRRDLNRSFPGSSSGSLAARLAHLFMTEVVTHCDYGIDLHSGSDDRDNMPQVRADLDDAGVRELALAFGAPITVHARPPAGSLRAEAAAKGARTIVYEAGEAKRFTENAVRTGVSGVLSAMSHLGMLADPVDQPPRDTIEVRSTRWVRASRGGICRLDVKLGQTVREGEKLGFISDAFGADSASVLARISGTVIGRRLNPMIHRGEAVVHIAAMPGQSPTSE